MKMMPPDINFAAHLAQVVIGNATTLNVTTSHLLNATASQVINHTVNSINATAETIAAPSTLSIQMPWIELCLIPIVPVLACYLFTKLADRHSYSKAHPSDNVSAYEVLAEAGEQPSTPITRLGTLHHGAVGSSRLAGANAENPVIIDLESSSEEGYVAESEAQSEDLEDTWSKESSEAESEDVNP